MNALSAPVWFITGCSTGLGRALAQAAIARGLRVVATARDPGTLAGIVDGHADTAIALPLDLTQPEQIAAAVRAAEQRFGAIDVLVNNAYFPFQVSALHEISWEKFHEAIDHELSAFYHCVQACLPDMKDKKAGKIIVVSTRLAQQPLPRMGAYAAAKSALESMANTMAIELGPLGIAVNVVTPAFTLTDASLIMPEAFRERVKETRPLKKHLYPEDVAGAIAFLAGEEASMLTGSHILITGGSHLQL